MVTKSKELISIAERMGYVFKNVKEGKAVIDSSGRIITRISKHKNIKWPTAKNILKALASGEPNL